MAFAELLEAAIDGGGLDSEDGIFPARAVLRVFAGHLIRQTECAEISARANLKDPKSLKDW